MKKSLLVICFIIFSEVFSLKSQNSIADFLPLKSSKVTFTDVIEKKESTVEAFAEKATQWMYDQEIKDVQLVYPNDKKVRLKGRCSISLLWGPNDFKEFYKDVMCDVEITIKKDRYQYRFSNFTVQEPGREIQLEVYKSNERKLRKHNEDFYRRIDAAVKKMIVDLNSKMNVPLIEKPELKNQ